MDVEIYVGVMKSTIHYAKPAIWLVDSDFSLSKAAADSYIWYRTTVKLPIGRSAYPEVASSSPVEIDPAE